MIAVRVVRVVGAHGIGAHGNADYVVETADTVFQIDGCGLGMSFDVLMAVFRSLRPSSLVGSWHHSVVLPPLLSDLESCFDFDDAQIFRCHQTYCTRVLKRIFHQISQKFFFLQGRQHSGFVFFCPHLEVYGLQRKSHIITRL